MPIKNPTEVPVFDIFLPDCRFESSQAACFWNHLQRSISVWLAGQGGRVEGKQYLDNLITFSNKQIFKVFFSNSFCPVLLILLNCTWLNDTMCEKVIYSVCWYSCFSGHLSIFLITLTSSSGMATTSVWHVTETSPLSLSCVIDHGAFLGELGLNVLLNKILFWAMMVPKPCCSVQSPSAATDAWLSISISLVWSVTWALGVLQVFCVILVHSTVWEPIIWAVTTNQLMLIV